MDSFRFVICFFHARKGEFIIPVLAKIKLVINRKIPSRTGNILRPREFALGNGPEQAMIGDRNKLMFPVFFCF